MRKLKVFLLTIICALGLLPAKAQLNSSLTVVYDGIIGNVQGVPQDFTFYVLTSSVSYFHNFTSPGSYQFTFTTPADLSWVCDGGTFSAYQTYAAYLSNPIGIFSWWLGYDANGNDYYLYREKISNRQVRFWIGT